MSWWGALHHNVFVYATEAMSSSASLLHGNLLKSSDTAPNWIKNILQSMDEESTKNIILICYERRSVLSLQEGSVCFIPTAALIRAFLMKLFFWANCIQLGKIFAHPIRGQSIPHLRVQLCQYPYFKEFRYPKAVNSTLLLWFFKYISQTSNNKQKAV